MAQPSTQTAQEETQSIWQSLSNVTGDAWEAMTSNAGEVMMKNQAEHAAAAGEEVQAEQFMALSKLADMEENYPNLHAMNQEYPEVFEKIKLQTMGGDELSPQEMIDKIKAGEKVVDIDQVNMMENLIADNPENARQVMETLKNNPEFADFALMQTGAGADNAHLLRQAIENPEMVQTGAEFHKMSQSFTNDFKLLFHEHLSGSELGEMDFEGFFEGIMELFQGLIGQGGALLEGSSGFLAGFAENKLGMDGISEQAAPESQPGPQPQAGPQTNPQANPNDPNAPGPKSPQPGAGLE